MLYEYHHGRDPVVKQPDRTRRLEIESYRIPEIVEENNAEVARRNAEGRAAESTTPEDNAV